CEDIEKEVNRLAPLGYVIEGQRFTDPRQGVHGLFVAGHYPRLELLQALASDGVLSPWLRSGVKLYHLAYLTADIEQSIVSLRSNRTKLVVAPVEAAAFNGRQIAFVMLPNRMLIELIARE